MHEGSSQHPVDTFVSQDAQLHLTFVVIGETGQGKSTLINSLLGQQLAKESNDFDPGTTCLNYYHLSRNNVQIKIWDTPDFALDNPKKEEKYLQQMARDIKDIDLMLYCIRMDNKRWPKQGDVETILKITKIFTKKIWSQCLFVLTFANCVIKHLPEQKQGDLASQFSHSVINWERKIQEQLRKTTGLNSKEQEDIRVVPVGYYVSKKGENPWKLPNRKDWHDSFWVECSNQLHKDPLLTSLLLKGTVS